MQSPFRLAKRVFSLNFKANLYVIIVVLGLVVALPRAFIHSGGDPERFLSEFMPYMIFAAAILLYVLLLTDGFDYVVWPPYNFLRSWLP